MKKTTPTKKSAPAESKSLNTPKAVEAAAKKLKEAKAAAEKSTAVAPAPAKPAKAVKAAPAEKPAAVKKASAPKAVATPAAPKSAKGPAVTKIVAAIDVGFGNHLTIRGEGPGLTWDSGVVMACSDDGQSWIWSSSEVTAPVTFKVLANDIAWSAGEDFVVSPGETISISPIF